MRWIMACTIVLTWSHVVRAEPIITQVFSPNDLNGPLHVEDFEDDEFTPGVHFSAATGVTRYPADFASSGVTTSGTWVFTTLGGSEFPVVPIRADFPQQAIVKAVGLYFGNDHDGTSSLFSAYLDAYDSSGLLGTVGVEAGRNDFVDQFIGFNSNVPLTHVLVRYGNGSDVNAYVVIDDFQYTVPEPTTSVLLGLGVFVLATFVHAASRPFSPVVTRRAA